MKYTLPLFCLSLFAASCGSTPESQAETESAVVEVSTSHEDWSKNATIYEANIRQYSPEGTFNAFTKDIPRIAAMGIKILWLMPIHPIGEENRKGTKGSYYSVKDYKGVNPEFGTDADFQKLVDTAHENGLKVIIDWVANHSAFDNAWTTDHLDWYTLDSLGKLQPPIGTDWWDVADLDFDNQEMRTEMIASMRYWLDDFGIDGFRCDVASMVPTDFWNQCRDSLEISRPDVFMLAEAESPELQAHAFEMGYAWHFMHVINQVAKAEEPLSAIDDYMLHEDTNFSKDDYRMYFTTNHDENSWNGTVMERYGDEGHLAYATLAYTIGGMPLLYSGQEAGMDYSLEFFEKDTIDWGDYALSDFYTKLLKLNVDNPALWNGEYRGDYTRLKTNADERIYAFVRTKDAHQVVVICNLSDAEHNLEIENLPNGNFTSLFDATSIDDLRGGLTIEPFQYLVFSK